MENSKVAEAVEKINKEMGEENNPYVRIIGEFLLKQVNNNEDIAKAILTEGKTIMKSLDEMKKVAKQRAINGCAVMEDEEGFKIVMDYFGINKKIDIKNSETKVISLNEYKKIEAEPKVNKFEVNLDDLL